MRGEGREEKGGEGRGEGSRGKAFLVMWPRRLSALNPPCLSMCFVLFNVLFYASLKLIAVKFILHQSASFGNVAAIFHYFVRPYY